ncbi:serine/threonine-protein kinase [Streptomyces macrosporus]|uniref:non-specific serine/threonine protein kinase n=1 Tax=Streptomyces macrosporus TaxID=44032 RepID=A0ABN3KB33_9ACTN
MNGRRTAHGAGPEPGGEPTGEGRGLLSLPEVPPPASPEALVLRNPTPPLLGRPCGNPRCRRTVGTRYPGTPVRYEGYCPNCGTRYSLLPQLRPGEPLDGGRYEVRGPLAHGGLGWVYLAVDTRLRNRPIVLKGVLNPHDPEARERMLEERNQMIAIGHESIVRIVDYVPHQPDDDRTPADYIVMEYVGGKSLRGILEDAGTEAGPFGSGEPLTLEHVARYGCRILGALAVLHDRGLVYSDMKPDNVIHRGDRVVLIDLGGVQRPGDPDRTPVTTKGYAAPEVEDGKGPPTVAHDVHTVGRTLAELARAAVDGEPGAAGTGLGHDSFHRVVERATHARPERRFSSATEMSEQLEGVLRELISLRTGRQYTRPSDVFAPTHALLDAGLGAVPGLGRWRDRRARAYRRTVTSPPLDPGRPTPSRVAAGLPVPLPRRDDPADVQLRLPAPQDPRAVVRRLESFLDGDEYAPSVEVRLRLCRAHLEVRDNLSPGDRERGERLREAERRLREAEEILGLPSGRDSVPDWRIAWHRGLVRLAREEVGAAEEHFAEVHGALPGEYAPKLALGYCAEHRGDLDRAERFYHAVWRRNTQQGSAAFGLARVHLARGEREKAVDVLGRVPPMSRHYDAVRIAAVRIRAARLSPGRDGLPDRRGLAAVQRELPRLVLDTGERARLEAEIREWALDWLQRVTAPPGTAPGAANAPAAGAADGGAAGTDGTPPAELGGALFGGGPGEPPTERGLRTLLARSFRDLAHQPGVTRAENEHLVDCSNAVFPRTWFVRPAEEPTR